MTSLAVRKWRSFDRCCVWLLAEMRSSCAVFYLNNRKSGMNRNLRFYQFPKKLGSVPWVWCVLFIKPCHHKLHISELTYALTHGTFQSLLEIYKTADTYSLQICDYLSQIQRETKEFLLIVRHNTEGPPFSDCQWRHRTLFFFVGLKNMVNLVLFFKPWFTLSKALKRSRSFSKEILPLSIDLLILSVKFSRACSVELLLR